MKFSRKVFKEITMEAVYTKISQNTVKFELGDEEVRRNAS